MLTFRDKVLLVPRAESTPLNSSLQRNASESVVDASGWPSAGQVVYPHYSPVSIGFPPLASMVRSPARRGDSTNNTPSSCLSRTTGRTG